MSKTTVLYGTGGLGTNIAKKFANVDGFRTAYFDTSRSNIGPNDEANAYLIPGVDGSGKVRGENIEAIKQHVAPLLTKYPPGDFNIVIFSAGGGTGSGAGTLVLNELMTRDLPVIGVVMGETDSGMVTSNSIKTLQSLSGLAAKHNKAVSVLYRDMIDRSRREVDQLFIDGIGAIQQLVETSSLNDSELDSMDVKNWLYYNRLQVGAGRAGLGLINIFSTNERLAERNDLLSVASIYADRDDEHGKVNTAYRTTGYNPKIGAQPLHLAITQNDLLAIHEQLQRKLDEQTKQASHQAEQHVVLHTARSGDDFLVL